MNAFGPDWEDGVPRVVTDCVDRTHKLKALGNALIPQVAYQIFQAIEGTAGCMTWRGSGARGQR